jgi:hypothetical protein
MGIKSEPFYGVILSGREDIQKFERQIRYARPTKEAVATVGRGEKLVSEYQKRGFVTLSAKRDKKVK